MSKSITAYGPVECIRKRDIPPVDCPGPDPAKMLPRGFWRDLANDLLLRLEKTPRHEALKVTFASAVLCHRARMTLNYHFIKRLGRGAVSLAKRPRHDPPALYIWRGPSYHK